MSSLRCRWLAGFAMAALGCQPAPTAAPTETAGASSTAPGRPESATDAEDVPAEPEGIDENALVADWLARESVDCKREADAPCIALTRRGPVRFTADGPELGGEDLRPIKDALRLVVIDDGPTPRVITNDRDVRLLVHVNPSDAVPQVAVRAPLRPSAEPLPDRPTSGFVVLHPGAKVRELERTPDAVRVEYRRGKETHRGWVSVDQLSITSIGHDNPDPPKHVVHKRVTLKSGPKGKAMAKLGQGEFVTLLQTRDGTAVVDYRRQCDWDVSRVGFLPAKLVVEAEFGRGYSCGGDGARFVKTWGKANKAPRKPVNKGSFLADGASGKVVGCVLRDTELADLGDGLLGVPSIWGALPVKLAGDDAKGPCGTGT